MNELVAVRCDAMYDGKQCVRYGGRCVGEHVVIETKRLYPYGYWSYYIVIKPKMVEYKLDKLSPN